VDLPMLAALQDEWRDHPPVHHLVAAYLDYKPSGGSSSTSPEQDQNLKSIMDSMPVANGPAFALDTSAWDAANERSGNV
jgi:hypothetical protein